MPSRFKLSATATLAALALLGASCGSSAGDAPTVEGAAADIVSGECVGANGETVTIYSGRTENLIQPILDAFVCETGVDVQVRWGDSADLALLLAEEGDASDADVFLSSSPGPVGFLEGEGLLGTLDADTLELVSADNQASAGTWIGFSGRKRVLVYNLDNVADGELPASVLDLTDPAYADRVAIPATNGSFEDWFTVFRDTEGNDVATQWINDMAANGARTYPNNRSIVEAVGRGEIDMGLVNHYYNYQESAARGDEHRAENFDFAAEDIGSLLIITAATKLESSEHSDTANALIQYLLTPGAQTYFTQETFEYPLAAGIDPADVLPPLVALEIGSVDFDSLGGGFADTERIIQESGILNN